MKFLSEMAFYLEITRAIREDGLFFGAAESNSSGIKIVLQDLADGSRDVTHVLYLKQEDYNRSGMQAGDEKVGA